MDGRQPRRRPRNPIWSKGRQATQPAAFDVAGAVREKVMCAMIAIERIRRLAPLAAAVGLAAVLSGCGGGSPATGLQPSAPGPSPSAPGPLPSDPLTSDGVQTLLERRLADAAYPVVASFGGAVAVCQALGCPVIDAIHVDMTVGDRRPDLAGFEHHEPRRGIDLASRHIVLERDPPIFRDTFGAWTDHGFFLVDVFTGQGDNDFRYETLWFGDAGDKSPVTAASGTARWAGVMSGVTVEPASDAGALVHGDAAIAVTGLDADASITVRFSNISRQDTGAAVAGMTWSGLPLQGRSFGTADIRFDGARGYALRAGFGAEADGSLFGHIYGPNHEEVGGLFNRNGIAGAFAARRE